MPKRTDLHNLLIIGSGPIIIGQAAEFDFSGSQASRSLREEGYRTIIVNSNPATIQTDTDTADVVYIEPLDVETITQIIKQERPDAILPGFGGQTALNLAYRLAQDGILKQYNVALLGSSFDTIEMAENRQAFRDLLDKLHEPAPISFVCDDFVQIQKALDTMSFPVLVRPAYTLGGTGGGVAESWDQLETLAANGLRRSPIHQVLIEENLFGWKEFEYEVMRDSRDNCITICSMENINPMGFHTGESIVTAPCQTLTDQENQHLRTVSLKIVSALDICGGCNIQFAVHPKKWEYRVIEVNPRVSRSSALASKATGYPIARVSAKVAVGMTLDEIPNAVTRNTFAAFEPALDYVVVKIPRWPFDKFPTVDRTIGTQMKSTGEAMAIGSSLEEALMKALRALETKEQGFEPVNLIEYKLIQELQVPTDRLLLCIAEALRRGYTVPKIAELTRIDAFFVSKIANVVGLEKKLTSEDMNKNLLTRAKRIGMSDPEIARLTGKTIDEIRHTRKRYGLKPVFNVVDTCAGEFQATTPYYYSTYLHDNGKKRKRATKKKRILIIGSGPIRIGQGIEFDYCCVHAALAIQESGHEAIMMNSNPETVSTDFDISTRLYFEPLTLEDALNVIDEEGCTGIILQFGGQTSLNLAMPLASFIKKKEIRCKILGTQPAHINLAEDRKVFSSLLKRLHIPHPPFLTGKSYDEVKTAAKKIGYPVIVRPSYVLGGRAMEIVYEQKGLEQYMSQAAAISPQHPVLVDKYLTDAIEVDVDALSDGKETFVAGIMEHIEQAGVHSGDSYAVIPPYTLPDGIIKKITSVTLRLARALHIRGLLNIQFAVKDNTVYVLEANPRASRTIPFVAKTIGIPLAKLATQIMLGTPLKNMEILDTFQKQQSHAYVSIKGPVFPFQKLPGVDPILGPEMKSTGEIMAIDRSFGAAYYKAILSDDKFNKEGTVYITVRDTDKPKIVEIAKALITFGFSIVATRGTAEFLRERGMNVQTVYRISEQQKPNAVDLMRQKKIDLIINTPTLNFSAKRDGYAMRRCAVEYNIPFITSLTAAQAEIEAIRFARKHKLMIRPLHEYHTWGQISTMDNS